MKMFCPKCGAMMVVKKQRDKKVLECRSCGYVEKSQDSMKIKEKTTLAKAAEVVDSSAEDNTLPKVEIKCPKCGNHEAYFWTVQTRASDEPETKFYRCTKCKHTWRDYQ